MLTKDEFTELFEMQVRGTIATAFVYGQVPPMEYWSMLRGEEELTLRAIGEIGHLTGFNMNMQLSERRNEDTPND